MKAKFTGHDTFPLRYGWLYKAVNHLNLGGKLQVSNEEAVRDAIVKLGVGKNMVNAIRYWAEASGVIESNSSSGFSASLTGQFLLDEEEGEDPYLERVGSIWLIHFWLNFKFDSLTSYRYFFNYSNVQHFEKSKLVSDSVDAAQQLISGEIGNENTLKKDIDCFLNTYCKRSKNNSGKNKSTIDEDHFTSPLSELNLVQDAGSGAYISNLEEREELPIEIFIYGMIRFAQLETLESKINTVDFDSLLSKPFSPGRIFRFSETGLGQKLDQAQEFTNGKISWIDSLGLRQIQIAQDILQNPDSFLKMYYEAN